MAQAGREEGLAFSHDKMQRTPNTLDGHRLLWMALQEHGAPVQNTLAQELFAQELFAAYFTRGEDVVDRATLVRLAASCGLDAGRVESFLSSEEGTGAVRAEEAWASREVSGVPFFVLAGRIGVPGAQPAWVMLDAIRQAPEEQVLAGGEDGAPPQATAPSGDACEGGVCSVEPSASAPSTWGAEVAR